MSQERRTRYDYFGTDILFGRGSTAELTAYVREHGWQSVLLVSGGNVGANPAVIGPLREALAGVRLHHYQHRTRAKTLATIFEGVAALEDAAADVIIGVGGGSSLDIARQISVFAAQGRDITYYQQRAEQGPFKLPDDRGERLAVLVVPTTLAGADLASGGSIAVTDQGHAIGAARVRIGGRLMPTAVVYDPALFEAAPIGALHGSAINGFDKGVENLYSAGRSTFRDATALRGVQLLRRSLPELESGDPCAFDRVVEGLVLVQYRLRISVIHAFGHGFSRNLPMNQGLVHAVMAPHVVDHVLTHSTADTPLLAEALDVDLRPDDEAMRRDVVTNIEAVRDALGLPSRLRELMDPETFDPEAIAGFVCADPIVHDGPEGFELTRATAAALIRAAW